MHRRNLRSFVRPVIMLRSIPGAARIGPRASLKTAVDAGRRRMSVLSTLRELDHDQRHTVLASFLGWTLDAFD